MGSFHERHGHFYMIFMMEVLCSFMRKGKIMKKRNKTLGMRRKTYNRNKTVDG